MRRRELRRYGGDKVPGRAESSIEAIRKSGGRLGEVGIPEMLDYLRRIGYKVGAGGPQRYALLRDLCPRRRREGLELTSQPDDLNKLNVVHVTGTKGKGSTSAFTERILRAHLPGKIGKWAVGQAHPDPRHELIGQACTPRRTSARSESAYE